MRLLWPLVDASPESVLFYILNLLDGLKNTHYVTHVLCFPDLCVCASFRQCWSKQCTNHGNHCLLDLHYGLLHLPDGSPKFSLLPRNSRRRSKCVLQGSCYPPWIYLGLHNLCSIWLPILPAERSGLHFNGVVEYDFSFPDLCPNRPLINCGIGQHFPFFC
jgi:hypothetical protein